MDKSTTLASQDPTFETQGPMNVFLNNQTDMRFSLDPSQATLKNDTSPTPPPAWVLGRDWQVLSAYLSQPPWPYPQAQPLTGVTGCANVIAIANRGTSSVKAGGVYICDQPLYIPNTSISMHFTISGVAGGSTVLPGFGLFNLVSNPGAWTYVTPTDFDGSWSIQLRSPDYFNLATLSVSYVPYGWQSWIGASSRLFYSVAGSGMLLASVPGFSPGTEDARSIKIVRASGEYGIITNAVKQMGADK